MRTLSALILAVAFFAATASAGVFHVVSYPVRHSVKTARAVLKTVSYPVRHPVKTLK
jgi:hypothetical protein